MNTKAKKYDVIDGPNRDTLFDACKYSYDKNMRIQVGFTIAAAYTTSKKSGKAAYIPMDATDFRICSIGHEDGSGKSLIIQGYCKADVRPFGTGVYRTYKFDMYYHTGDRRGFVEFVEY